MSEAAELARSSTRNRLVETAARLFHEQGFHATGVAAILREAGVNSGSLYYFFDSKEALLEAVLEDYAQRLERELIAPIEAETSAPLARVCALLDVYRRSLLMTGFAYGCPIGNLALEVGAEEGAVTQKIEQNFAAWRAALRRWLEQWSRETCANADLEALSGFVLTVMEGGVMQARIAKSIAPFDDAVGQLKRYLRLLEHDDA